MPASIIRPTRCARATACAAGACCTSSAPPTASATANAASSSWRPTRPNSPRSRRSWRRRRRNGVEGIEMIGGNAARAMEPELFCIGALWSPETGIIDSHGYMLALWGELEDRGGMIAFETPVERMSYKAPHWHVQFGGRDAGVMPFDAVVNAAGLGAQALARRIEGYPAGKGAAARARQGQLFRLRRPAGVLAADLSDADRRRPRRPRHARSCRPHAVRPRRRMDHARRTTPSIRAAPTAFTPASAPIGRACRTARWCPIIAASGRSSPARASRRPIS